MARSKKIPTTQVVYRKDWHHQTAHYRVLSFTRMTPTDRKYVAGVIPTITNADEARNLAATVPDWTFELIDLKGTSGYLFYKGFQVYQITKRQVTEIIPDPGAPAPQLKIDDPSDMWIGLDLTGLSARQARRLVREKLQEPQDRVQSIAKELEANKLRLGILEEENWELKQRIKELPEEKKKVREEMAKEKIIDDKKKKAKLIAQKELEEENKRKLAAKKKKALEKKKLKRKKKQ